MSPEASGCRTVAWNGTWVGAGDVVAASGPGAMRVAHDHRDDE